FRNGVVKSGSSSRADGEEGFFELCRVVRESFSAQQFHRDIVIEIHDEELVLWVAGVREGRNCRGYFRELRAHAAAVVDDQAHGDGSVSVLKRSNFLEASVLVYAEVLLAQPRHDVSLCVRYTDGQGNHIRLRGNCRLGGSG